MNKKVEIFVQLLISLVTNTIFGFIGLITGGIIGMNIAGAITSSGYEIPTFLKGNVGWDNGGIFFGIIGISIGCIASTLLIKKLQKKKIKYLPFIITGIITIIIGQLAFDIEYMSPFQFFSIPLLPPIVFALVSNWQKFSD
jgi:hypothetical protein